MNPALCSGAPLFVVANGSTDSGCDVLLEQVVTALHRADCQFKVLGAERDGDLKQDAQHAALLARRYQGVLVAVGGDDTIHAVAQEALKIGCPFGALPLGSRNYFARAHGLPTDPEQAVAVWLDGYCEPVQIGEVNGHPFFVNASVGLPAQPVEAHPSGVHPNLWAALKSLLSWHSVMRIVSAGERSIRQFWSPTLFIGNIAPQLARLGMVGAVGRGRLTAICIAPLTLWRLLAVAARAAFGRKVPLQQVSSEPLTRMTVARAGMASRRRPMEVACDGEVHSFQAPLHFSALPQALRLIKPRREAAEAA